MDLEEQESKHESENYDIDHKRKFKEVADEYGEMIQFLDFSFERAFDRKEKDFLLAYRVGSLG